MHGKSFSDEDIIAVPQDNIFKLFFYFLDDMVNKKPPETYQEVEVFLNFYKNLNLYPGITFYGKIPNSA